MTSSTLVARPLGLEAAQSLDLLLESERPTPADLLEAIGLDLLEDFSHRTGVAA